HKAASFTVCQSMRISSAFLAKRGEIAVWKASAQIERRESQSKHVRRSTRFGVFIHRFIHSWNSLSVLEHNLGRREFGRLPMIERVRASRDYLRISTGH